MRLLIAFFLIGQAFAGDGAGRPRSDFEARERAAARRVAARKKQWAKAARRVVRVPAFMVRSGE